MTAPFHPKQSPSRSTCLKKGGLIAVGILTIIKLLRFVIKPGELSGSMGVDEGLQVSMSRQNTPPKVSWWQAIRQAWSELGDDYAFEQYQKGNNPGYNSQA